MHTKDKLAAALREVGLNDMADKAATGYFHDFLSPLDFPEMQLAEDLRKASIEALLPEPPDDAKAQRIIELRKRVINGDFDASTEESDEWMSSPEGKQAISALIHKPVGV